MIDVEDLVRVLDRRQAVRDDEARAPLEQMLQAGLQRLLGARVDVARRLVQDQDTRVGEQHAREGDELALAGRQVDPRSSTTVSYPSGSSMMNSCACTAFAAASISSSVAFELAVADVLAHVAGEDEGVLQHHAHLPAQRCERHVAHVVASIVTEPSDTS